MLHPRAARALEIRDKLLRLHKLKIGPAICQIYNVTADDLEMLAIAEEEITSSEEQSNGDGPQMDTECG